MNSTRTQQNQAKVIFAAWTLAAALLTTGCATSTETSLLYPTPEVSPKDQPAVQLELRSVLPWALVEEDMPFSIHLTNLDTSTVHLHDETVIVVTCKAGDEIYSQTFPASVDTADRQFFVLKPRQSFKQDIRFSTKFTNARKLTFQAALKTPNPIRDNSIQWTESKPKRMKVLSEKQLAEAFNSIKNIL